METLLSGDLKVQLSDYIKTNGLNQIMQDTLLDYLLSLHVSELSKEQYLCRLRKFGFRLNDCLFLSYPVHDRSSYPSPNFEYSPVRCKGF